MDTRIIITIVLCAFVFLFVLAAVRSGKTRKAELDKRIREAFGKRQDVNLKEEQLDHIRAYSDREDARFSLDEITWNDLDMDRIYQEMNGTFSLAGAEYLYDLLRHPVFDEKELKKREKMLTLISEDEALRMDISRSVSIMTKKKSSGFYENYQSLLSIKQKKTIAFKLLAICNLIAIGCFFVWPVLAVFLFVATLIVNGLVHSKESREIENSLSCLSGFLRLLRAADELCKIQNPSFHEEKESLSKKTALFKGIRKKCLTITGSAGTESGLSALFAYFNNFFLLDLINFYAIADGLKENKDAILSIMETVGEWDAMCAIVSYRASLPYYVLPELTLGDHTSALLADQIYHPLLKEPVANSFVREQDFLITGSNASGKSTFLKTIAVNAILSQTIHTSIAKRYQAPFTKVLTSMALRDQIVKGESFYITEIKALKRIIDADDQKIPVLCCVDEVLKGTNTIERIAASSQVLSVLAKKNMFVFAATHDIELTSILEEIYDNYHFEEAMEEDRIHFPFTLCKGKATNRNAIALLSYLGYQKEISEEAKKRADLFEEDGYWRTICK